MSKNHSKSKINVTFSLPVDVNTALHAFVERRHLSSYVTKAIKKVLDYDREVLRQDYIAMSQDGAELNDLADWSALDVESWDE